MKFESNHINDIYLQIIDEVSKRPEYVVSPRGMEIKEIIGSEIVLTNPRNCLVTLADRKLNYKFAIVEKLEYLSGESNPECLVHYNKNLKAFQNHLGMYDGAYGPRLKRWLEYIYLLLKKDPDSRQAVATIYGPRDMHESKDIPCTLSLQFILRKNKLNLIVTMRSNDILWGTPYDINGFCFIQEVMACWLGVDLGTYYHRAGSLHLYTEREEQLTKIGVKTVNVENPTWTLDYENTTYDLRQFWMAEQEQRQDNIQSLVVNVALDYYLKQLK